ncbi:putative secretion system X protein GspG-like 2 [Methylophaga aminisulfidivorans MP]|uniref:Putative secretion system X protein GspG-like 2 n=1 Tax=Methylophaga aminisulfidivorans MP TaxID=1026882 RepID=F5T0J0_9GAMM|nr:prepilin-type N-terminal cleavage/methylation domain-containing protein [Methylophaga aminisulfidivorans]EGL55346.1 putative secretion system X protein GspG-like 2 [Methylophaga aminisulfidivorans MP]
MKTNKGFTLVEILVVLTIIAILLSLVAPRYFASIDRSKEKVLRHDLIVMRSAIDQYFADRNAYPDTLEQLVDGRYLREVPVDPITDRRDTWVFTPPKDSYYEGDIANVYSDSELISSEGTPYAEW